MNQEKKKCLYCGDTLLGRVDKKFCSDDCRARAGAEKRKKNLDLFKQTHKKLQKNRSIILMLKEAGWVTIPLLSLQSIGFEDKLVTQIIYMEKNNSLRFIYDTAFLHNEENITLVEDPQPLMEKIDNRNKKKKIN
jgi:predicted nucleic acid-binding Zn ribbon protein